MSMMTISVFRSLLWLFLFWLSMLNGAQAATVLKFSPQGLVDQQTRVTVRFDRPLVKLGEMAAPSPFVVDCGKVSGSGQWVEAQVWIWQLDRPLAPGARCDFTPRTDFIGLEGERLDVPRGQHFRFFAGGPRPRSVQPATGSWIDAEQIFVIDAGVAMDPVSVQEKLWCEAEGVGHRMGIREVPESVRREVLKHVRVRGTSPLLVRCAEPLPANAPVKLVWGKGLRSVEGLMSEREERLSFRVRPPFRASLNCEREKADAPCSPFSGIRVEFTSDVDLKSLLAARLQVLEENGQTSRRSPQDPNAGSSVRQDAFRSAVFPGPFPARARLRLELPAGLRDRDGRGLENAARFPLDFVTGDLPPLVKFPGRFGILELKEGGVLPVTVRQVESPLRGREMNWQAGHRLSDQRLTDDAEIIATLRALNRFENRSRSVTFRREGRTETVEDRFYPRELSFFDRSPKSKSAVSQPQLQNLQQFDLPRPTGTAVFEVLGIPLTRPGFHVVEIESRMLGQALLAKPAPMYVRTAALVTNLAVHFKRGRDNALVWVTALDSGKPVAGAAVQVSDCKGKPLWNGKTDSAGRAMVSQVLDVPYCPAENEEESAEGWLFVSARLGEDYSFLRSDWNEGIEPWRFGVETWGDTEELKIHALLDRTLLRAGQTVSMKFLARQRDSRGFALPPASRLPSRVVVRHLDTGTAFPLPTPLLWDARGSALSQWKIPESARRGQYEIELSGGDDDPRTEGAQSVQGTRIVTRTVGEFSVSDFRLPVFTGSVQGVPARQIAPKKIPLSLALSFLNGGAARNAEVKVSASLRPRWPNYPHFERYGFSVDLDEPARTAFGVDESRERETLVLDQQAVRLDASGSGRLELSLPRPVRGPSELHAEMSFADPNGEIQTLRGNVELWPAAVVLGVNVRDWTSPGGRDQALEMVVLNTKGQAVAGQKIQVRGKRRIEYSHRRRIVGGFYAYERNQEFVDLGVVCSGTTDSRGRLDCTPKVKETGEILLLAETRDAEGNVARASTSYWMPGQGDLWFGAGNQDRMDVIPEHSEYRPGETARLQVRTPFREATALVTIEAGGIIESRVQPLSRFHPVIELPIKGEWGPNVYVSVLAVRGRLTPLKWYSFFQWGWREPVAWFREWWQPDQPTAMVDLSKPAFRLGLAELKVGQEAFRLQVDVQPEKNDYRPREIATVNVRVSLPDGRPVPAGSELAFAAVDQALLELKPNESWKLLDAMLQRRGHEVETATAQSQVIGKRHYGRKALPPGGGGGRAPARELFDTLLLWQPRVQLDAQGRAQIRVPINDSLSEFRLVGVATSGVARFGTGVASFRTRQDLQLIAGVPPQVREGDRYRALLTLRNSTTRSMNLQVTARAGGLSLPERTLTLPPQHSEEVGWEVQAPKEAGEGRLEWEFQARETGEVRGESGKAAVSRDHLKITQQVVPAVPLTIIQSSLQRIDAPLVLPLSLPAGALPGRGSVDIGLSARLSVLPPGVRQFFLDYPYTCLEQRVSVAVGLHDVTRWQDVVASLPTLQDANGLLRYFPGEGAGSVALTAHVLNLAYLAGFTLPEVPRQNMMRALRDVAEARLRSQEWSASLDESRLNLRLLALNTLVRIETPASSVGSIQDRATRIAAAWEIVPDRLSTSALIDWWELTRKLSGLPQREAHHAAATQALQKRLSQAGGRLVFTHEAGEDIGGLMSNADVNTFRLIEAVRDDPVWREDLPRLVRGVQEGQTRGHWRTTTANAWARVVLDRYAQRFERTAVSGQTRARMEGGEGGKGRKGGAAASEEAYRWQAGAVTEPVLHLPWPAAGGNANAASSLSLRHEGAGQPWASVQLRAAVPVHAPRSQGYRIERSARLLQGLDPKQPHRGDVWQITLKVEALQNMSWVVIDDPIPSGARILDEGLGRDASLAALPGPDEAGGFSGEGSVYPTHVERTFGGLRAYYEFMPRGKLRLRYTLRLNHAGQFTMPPTRVEALYAPDYFGLRPNAPVTVLE